MSSFGGRRPTLQLSAEEIRAIRQENQGARERPKAINPLLSLGIEDYRGDVSSDKQSNSDEDESKEDTAEKDTPIAASEHNKEKEQTSMVLEHEQLTDRCCERDAVTKIENAVKNATPSLLETASSLKQRIPEPIYLKLREMLHFSLAREDVRTALLFVIGEFWGKASLFRMQVPSDTSYRSLETTAFEMAALTGVQFDTERRTFLFPEGLRLKICLIASFAPFVNGNLSPMEPSQVAIMFGNVNTTQQ